MQPEERIDKMFKTGDEAYEFRRGTWVARRAREQREEEERQRAGEGVSRPLSRVPEIDRYMFDLNGCARSLACHASRATAACLNCASSSLLTHVCALHSRCCDSFF